MKAKIKRIGLMGLMTAALAVSAVAQPALTGTNGLIPTVTGWVTSVDTNYSYADVIVWDGPLYQQQVNFANELGGSADLWHSANTPNNMAGTLFDAGELRFRQAGIGGILASTSAGDEFGYMKGNLRVFGFADFVYLNNPTALAAPDRFAWEIGAQVEHLFDPDGTGAALFISLQEHQKSPIVGGMLNISFGTIGGLLSKL